MKRSLEGTIYFPERKKQKLQHLCDCCGNTTIKLESCTNCSHYSCSNCLFGDICDCHYYPVETYKELEEKIQEMSGSYFYVGAYDGQNFELYVQEPTRECIFTRKDGSKFGATGEHLADCYY